MAPGLASVGGSIPDEATLIARAQALIPLLRDRAAETEAAGRIDDAMVRMLADAGFFNIVKPVRAGGFGTRHTSLWKVAREVGRACASTGWILGLIGISPWIVGMFDASAQDEVFAQDNPIVPVMTGGVGRELSVRRRDGGFDVTGAWTYGSGIDLAEWAIVMAPAPADDGSDRLEPMLFLVPQSAFEIDHGSWNMLGMRGTGSKTVRLTGISVPGHRAISWIAAQQGEFPGRAVNGDAMYDMPMNALFAMSVVAPIVGAATGAADAALDILRQRVRGGAPQRDEAHCQIEVGSAVADIEMAAAMLLSDADSMYDVVASGRPFTTQERARYRMHCATIARTLLAGVDRLAALAGGSGIRSGTPFERAFRDVHAMTTHFLMAPDIAAECYGRLLLGLDLPKGARI